MGGCWQCNHMAWREDLDRLAAQVAALRCEVGEEAAQASGLVARVYTVFGDTTTQVTTSLQKAVEQCCKIASSAVMDEPTPDERGRIDATLKTLYYVNQAFNATLISNRALIADTAQVVGDDDLAAGIARFSKMDTEDANKIQQLLLYLLNCAQTRGYRRSGGDCYKRLYTLEGHDTHAWERVCSMQDFVYDATRKEINYEMWLCLTSMRANVGAAVDHLINCHDVQIPDLQKDRHVFSFKNGIYMAAEDRFLRYGTKPARALPSDTIAAKYFDLVFDPHDELVEDDWFAVETPHMQSILDYQGMDDDVSRWMYVMIGRLMYDVNEKDKWQVLPYLKGAASSGKSTILTCVCRALYEASDVGVMSNNIERKFGLSALHDKFIFIGPEIKSDMALEQAEFQSIVSGETVQIAVKFQTAHSRDWKVPGILAGNEVPGWVDNSGSINRRIILFEFTKRVDDGDMELGKKLSGEMAAIVLKANRGYLSAVRKFARDNVWKHLPAAFHRAKEEFTENVNSLVSFLRSGIFHFDADKAYMPMLDFATEYRSYVERMGLPKLKSLSGDALTQPLMGASCKVKKTTLKYPRHGNTYITAQFVLGAELASARHDEVDPLGE